jgi:hypothetical protein
MNLDALIKPAPIASQFGDDADVSGDRIRSGW